MAQLNPSLSTLPLGLKCKNSKKKDKEIEQPLQEMLQLTVKLHHLVSETCQPLSSSLHFGSVCWRAAHAHLHLAAPRSPFWQVEYLVKINGGQDVSTLLASEH